MGCAAPRRNSVPTSSDTGTRTDVSPVPAEQQPPEASEPDTAAQEKTNTSSDLSDNRKKPTYTNPFSSSKTATNTAPNTTPQPQPQPQPQLPLPGLPSPSPPPKPEETVSVRVEYLEGESRFVQDLDGILKSRVAGQVEFAKTKSVTVTINKSGLDSVTSSGCIVKQQSPTYYLCDFKQTYWNCSLKHESRSDLAGRHEYFTESWATMSVLAVQGTLAVTKAADAYQQRCAPKYP
jgi:hypothetical protein